MRAILIQCCLMCPHRTHSGGFTIGGAIPLCGATHVQPDPRYLNRYRGTRKPLENDYETATPDWCPLPEINHG